MSDQARPKNEDDKLDSHPDEIEVSGGESLPKLLYQFDDFTRTPSPLYWGHSVILQPTNVGSWKGGAIILSPGVQHLTDAYFTLTSSVGTRI